MDLTPIEMDIIFLHRREPMVRLDPIESPVNGLGNLPEDFQIKDLAFETRGGIEPAEDVSLGGILGARCRALAIDIRGFNRNIVNMSHRWCGEQTC